MKIFCQDLRELAMKIIAYEKKKKWYCKHKENKSYEKEKVCFVTYLKKDLVLIMKTKKIIK